MDLEKYIENFEEEFFTGLYSVNRIPENLREEYKSGVIFLLKQESENVKAIDYNPFHPYYLIYITDDGEIVYSYTHTKNILDIIKKIGIDNKEVDIALEENLKIETKSYKDMSKYRKLLNKAIEEIIGKKEEDGVASLFTPGGTSIDNQEDSIDSFELISYMILE